MVDVQCTVRDTVVYSQYVSNNTNKKFRSEVLLIVIGVKIYAFLFSDLPNEV